MIYEWSVAATFPEAPAAHAQIALTVRASDMGLAVRRALRRMRKRPNLRGRHLKTARILVVQGPRVNGTSAKNEGDLSPYRVAGKGKRPPTERMDVA